MKFYHFGDFSAPVIMLLPGTCCHWKLNFGQVIPLLEHDFHVVCVSYDGFDDTKNTVIHCFYAKKMGEKYLERYKKHFKNPVIHTFNMEHEELLVLYPQQWAKEIKEICL